MFCGLCEQGAGGLSVPLPYFNGGSGNFDKPLQKLRGRTASFVESPDFFPGLVCLPVEAMVEELYSPKITLARFPLC